MVKPGATYEKSAEVVMFFYDFFDMPGAFEVLRENNEVAWAKTYGVRIVSNRYFAFKN
jgi:hypothetical protein